MRLTTDEALLRPPVDDLLRRVPKEVLERIPEELKGAVVPESPTSQRLGLCYRK